MGARARDFDHNALSTRARAGELYAAMHAGCPVFRSESWGGFWVAARHAALREVGRDLDTFASGDGVLVPPLGHGRLLLPMEADGALHRAYRGLLLPQLGPQAVAALEPQVREVTGAALDELLPRGGADMYEEYGKRIPASLITRLLGIEDEPDFWDWTETLIYGRFEEGDGGHVREAGDALRAFFVGVVERRRPAAEAGAGDDLVSVLIRAHAAGEVASNEDVVDLCFFLLIAGLDNTAFAIRAVLWHLAAHPDDRQALLDDPALVRPAVEECLRMYPPVTALARSVRAPTEVDGAAIGPGDRVLLLYGAANRDPALFADPDTFRLDRAGNPHVAFGVGAHRCIGSHLARLEIRIAIEEILRRAPAYELAEPETTSWHPAGPLELRWSGESPCG
jgi:hypothetical protein